VARDKCIWVCVSTSVVKAQSKVRGAKDLRGAKHKRGVAPHLTEVRHNCFLSC